MSDDKWLIEANEIAATVSRQVHRKYAVYFDAADVQQELVSWCLNKEHKVREWLNPDQEAADRKIGIKYLAKAMNREAEKYCRARKAKSVGYETRDEAFYTKSMIEELMAHLDELENLGQSNSANVRVSNGGSDPATGNNYLVSVLDIGNALGQLDPMDQLMLGMKYREGMTLAQISTVLELSDSTISRRINQALKRMSVFLGGESPWSGGRRVVSNAQARSVLE